MYKAIPKNYPKAKKISHLLSEILSEFNSNNLNSHHSIWATSICSDEVTNIFTGYEKHFAGPGPFRLGGISGLPFTGITGLRAFFSHVPNRGSAMIIYGPHIGVSVTGVLGKVNRESQSGLSTCCGSLVGALSAVEHHEELPLDNPLDYQQARVIRHLHNYREDILASKEPLKMATEFAYEAIEIKLFKIIDALKNEFPGLKILTVGGIVINTSWNIEDYFEVRNTTLFDFT